MNDPLHQVYKPAEGGNLYIWRKLEDIGEQGLFDWSHSSFFGAHLLLLVGPVFEQSRFEEFLIVISAMNFRYELNLRELQIFSPSPLDSLALNLFSLGLSFRHLA
jgi:hypothetical protein